MKRGGGRERRITGAGDDQSLNAAPALGASSPLLYDDEEEHEDFPLLPDAEEDDDLAAGGRERDKSRQRLRRRGTGGLWRGGGVKEPALRGTLHRGAGHELFDMSFDSTTETTSSLSSSPSQ